MSDVNNNSESLKQIIKNISAIKLKVYTCNDSLIKVQKFVTTILTESGCDKKFINQICIVIDELFGNVVRYAYAGQKGLAIIKAKVRDNKIYVQLIDHGTPFNPLNQSEPDTNLAVEDRPIGGLGILIAKKLTDEIKYSRRFGKNILSITKKLI